MKFCKKCSTEKPLSDFHSDGRTRDGISARCLSCYNAAQRARKNRANKLHYKRYGSGRHAEKRAEWHAKNPHKKFEYHAKKYQTVRGRAMALLRGAKSRLPDGFSLSLEHIIREIEKGHCPVTGAAFDLRINRDGKSNRSWSPFAPSIDKIDARKPYTDANTRVVSWQYNIMKGELSDSEVLRICRQIVTRSDNAIA